MFDWNDIKYFLAMADEGSLSAAARKLAISQPTLSRRLTALEENIGAELFARTKLGLEITSLGEQLIAHARHMQDDVHAAERLITGHDSSLRGTVIISCIETVGVEWLVGKVKHINKQYPGITIDIKIENGASDLLRREADIAIRMFRPQQNDLVAKKITTMNYGYYASKEYLADHGTPQTLGDLENHKIILPHGEIMSVINKKYPSIITESLKPALRSNSMTTLSAAVRSGVGIGGHSCLTASKDPELVRLFNDHVLFSTDIWLVSHADLRRSARIRAVFDYLASELKRDEKQFTG